MFRSLMFTISFCSFNAVMLSSSVIKKVLVALIAVMNKILYDLLANLLLVKSGDKAGIL